VVTGEESDLVLRNINTGGFEVYDIAANQLIGAASLGQVGLDWQLGAFAASSPAGSMGSDDQSGSNAQLVQAMASFGESGAVQQCHHCRHSTADIPNDATAIWLRFAK
jgi:hypothetical protein